MPETSAFSFGRNIRIIDISGIFDATKSNEVIETEILKCIRHTLSGPHAIILVLKFPKYTEKEQKPVQHFVDIFGEKICQHFILLFNTEDVMDSDVSNYVESGTMTLQTLIEKCGKRYITFNNRLQRNERDEQLQKLLSMISQEGKNNGECYRNEIYEKAENRLRERDADTRK